MRMLQSCEENNKFQFLKNVLTSLGGISPMALYSLYYTFNKIFWVTVRHFQYICWAQNHMNSDIVLKDDSKVCKMIFFPSRIYLHEIIYSWLSNFIRKNFNMNNFEFVPHFLWHLWNPDHITTYRHTHPSGQNNRILKKHIKFRSFFRILHRWSCPMK